MALFEQLLAEKWLIAVIFAALYVLTLVRKYIRLRQFNGPWSTGWCEVRHAFAILSLKSDRWYKRVTDKYGSIARIGPNDLLTTSPDLLAHMSAVRTQYTRAPWYYRATRVEAGRDHIFSQVDEEKHMMRRQQMAAGYSGKENFAVEPAIDEHIKQLLNLIRKKYLSTPSSSRPMDLAQKIQYLTLDVISKIGFGQAFGDLEADADVDDYIRSGEQGLKFLNVTCALGILPFLQWPPLARLIGPSEKDESGHGKMMAKSRQLIEARLRQPTDKRSDMLASFIRHGLNTDDLRTEAHLQILAGSDTTATAIRGTMLYIVSNPPVYFKLQKEIDAAVALGIESEAIVSDATARELPYLQAVLREGFRIHPPVTDIAPKKVPPGGDTVMVEGKSIFLPGGTNVGYSVYGLNRRKDIFGDDADQFRPERWLVGDGESESDRLNMMRRTTELIFGYGKYQCLGKNIAWMEYSKAVFELLRHFDWAIAAPEKPWKEANCIGIFMHEEMWVTATARQ